MSGPRALSASSGFRIPDEAQTVILAQRGEETALDELARSCRQQAYVFALQLTGNPDDALDVAQDAMLRFFRSLGQFDPSRPVRPWLLRIVRNLIRDRSRAPAETKPRSRRSIAASRLTRVSATVT